MINFDKMRKQVWELLDGEGSGHDFSHTIRVMNNALAISDAEEDVDIDVIRAAALLHDVAYSKDFFEGEHGDVSADIAKDLLKEYDFNGEQIDKILEAIRLHNFWFHNEKNVFIEVRILRDADRLDALGYTGIIRAISYASNVSKDGLKILEDQLVLEEQFETEKGKKLSKIKIDVMKKFIEELKRDKG